jgi:hypothetical protein
MFLRVAHAHDVRQFEVVRPVPVKHRAEQLSVLDIVFNQEQSCDLFAVHPLAFAST